MANLSAWARPGQPSPTQGPGYGPGAVLRRLMLKAGRYGDGDRVGRTGLARPGVLAFIALMDPDRRGDQHGGVELEPAATVPGGRNWPGCAAGGHRLRGPQLSLCKDCSRVPTTRVPTAAEALGYDVGAPDKVDGSGAQRTIRLLQRMSCHAARARCVAAADHPCSARWRCVVIVATAAAQRLGECAGPVASLGAAR